MRWIGVICIVLIACGWVLVIWPTQAYVATDAMAEVPCRELGQPHPGLVAALQLMVSLMALIAFDE